MAARAVSGGGAKVTSGFFGGFWSVFQALSWLARRPSAWPLALVPVIVFLALLAGSAFVAVEVVRPRVTAALAARALPGFGADLLGWLSAALVLGVGWFVSVLLAPPVSAPALERLVALVEAELGAPPRRAIGFWRELVCGFRAMAVAAWIALPLFLAISVAEWLAPPAVVVTTPLKFLLSSVSVAWGLLDYPLTLRGIGVRARVALFARRWPAVLGFGVAFALLFWVPPCGVWLLPVGVVAATRLNFAFSSHSDDRSSDLAGRSAP